MSPEAATPDTFGYARCAADYRKSPTLRQSRGERFAIAQTLEEFLGRLTSP